MVGAALARGAWCCIFLIVHHCCCDFCGTLLASSPKAEEETNKDLVQEDSHRSFGAENTQKDPRGVWAPQVPPYLEPIGSSQLSASSGRDVVALQHMQHPQFESSRNLPKMFSTLVQVLDTEAEEVEVKERQEQGQENDLTTIEARTEQKCPGCLSGTGPMDSEHASKSVACSQEGRELFARGRGFGNAPTTSTSTTSQATSSNATGKCFDDSGGDQALGESPRIASLRYDLATGDVGQATRIGAEGERSCNLQESDSRSYQQAPQDQRQACCAASKDQGHGSGMGQVRGHHVGEDHAPCQPLQTGSCGIGATVSREDVGVAELESRNQFSLEVHVTSSAGGTNPCPDGAACGTTIRKAARSTSRWSELLVYLFTVVLTQLVLIFFGSQLKLNRMLGNCKHCKTMTAAPNATVDGGGTISQPDWSTPQTANNPFRALRETWTRLILQSKLHSEVVQRFQTSSSEAPFTDEQLQPFKETLEAYLFHATKESMDWSIREHQPICLKALQLVSRFIQDPDSKLFPMLLAGVPTGLKRDIPASNVFAPAPQMEQQSAPEFLTHTSNWKSAEDHDDITCSLLQEELTQQWIVPFEGTLQQAHATFPEGVAVGKLSVAFSDTRPPRLVLDPTVSGANAAFHVPEKQNFPTALEVSHAYPLRDTVDPQTAFGLDVKSAHKRIVVRQSEQGLLMLQYRGRLYHYQVAPFGAKFSQHWWGRLGAFLLRFFHVFLYLKHAMYLFVDDYLLTSTTTLLPLQAIFVCLLCRIFCVPISWKKCTLGARQTWIGWQFDFHAGLISLHRDKQSKLLRMIADLRKHSRIPRKHLEKFLGLAMWVTALFPTMRVHLHWLYSDLARAPATLYSCQASNWMQPCGCLNQDLTFQIQPQGTSIPVGAKLVSVRHKDIQQLSDLQLIPITDKRLWLRVSDPNSTTRRLSGDSLRVLQLFQQWLVNCPPIFSMRPKQPWKGLAFSDAYAQGTNAGIGGFIQTPHNDIFWFSLQLQLSDFRDLEIPLQDDLQKDIVFLEALGQLALLHMLIRITGHCKLPFAIFTQTDNTGAESTLNSMFTTKFPLALVVERVSLMMAQHSFILDSQHVPGVRNEDADLLSRWHGDTALPQKFQPENRGRVSLPQLWSPTLTPQLFPKGSKLPSFPISFA